MLYTKEILDVGGFWMNIYIYTKGILDEYTPSGFWINID